MGVNSYIFFIRRKQGTERIHNFQVHNYEVDKDLNSRIINPLFTFLSMFLQVPVLKSHQLLFIYHLFNEELLILNCMYSLFK